MLLGRLRGPGINHSACHPMLHSQGERQRASPSCNVHYACTGTPHVDAAKGGSAAEPLQPVKPLASYHVECLAQQIFKVIPHLCRCSGKPPRRCLQATAPGRLLWRSSLRRCRCGDPPSLLQPACAPASCNHFHHTPSSQLKGIAEGFGLSRLPAQTEPPRLHRLRHKKLGKGVLKTKMGLCVKQACHMSLYTVSRPADIQERLREAVRTAQQPSFGALSVPLQGPRAGAGSRPPSDSLR